MSQKLPGVLATAAIVAILLTAIAIEPQRRQQASEDYRREVLTEGIELYAENCAACHGPGGEGNADGPALLGASGYPYDNLYRVIESKHFDGDSSAYGVDFGGNLAWPEIDALAQLVQASVWNATRAFVAGRNLYEWVPVVEGLDNPLLVRSANDGSGRLFALEQTGFILVIENGDYIFEPFLDISQRFSLDVFTGGYSERGLLGLAFHPNYAENGLFFVSHTDENGHSVIARYRVSESNHNRADPDSRVEILTQEQPFFDHNGGNIVFGPDGYLYIGFGDGGNPELPNYNSQDPSSFLGKILRIDVDSGETYTVPPDNPFVDDSDFRPEIWAYGVRNPWRFTFDRQTGDLFLGDVGQWEREEVNFQPADSPGGQNYGWSAFEATARYLEDVELDAADVTMPVIEYLHDIGCSVTGGYVYRGSNLPELEGQYFYGDYCSGLIWLVEPGAWEPEIFMNTDFVISSFGEDEDGELYVVDYKGGIYRLELATDLR